MSDNTATSFRLSPQQDRLWLTARADPDGRAQITIRLEGAQEPEPLTAALERVVARHEILRTRFTPVAGLRAPLQTVLDEPVLHFEAVAPGTDLDEARAQALRVPLDLRNGPLLNATLVPLDEPAAALVLTLPAVGADAGTLIALARDLAAVLADSADELAADPLQYADYAEWQHELRAEDDDEARAGREHWRTVAAAPAHPARLPFARPRGEAEPFSSSSVPLQLGESLEEAATRLSAEPSDVLLATWLVLLARLSGETEPLIGLVSDGREDEELSAALGPFATPKPLPVAVELDRPFRELVTVVAGGASAARRFGDYLELGEAPPVQFEWRAGQAGDLAPHRIEALHSDGEPFEVALVAHNGGAELRFDPSVHRREDIERAAAQLRRLLGAVAVDPDVATGELSLLGDEERRDLLAAQDGTGAIAEVCAHELFEAQAQRTPDRIAVASPDGGLTYAELNARANRLARVLVAKGVGTDSRVGLYMERSEDAIVAFLGILKAGGAYVPLSVEHPPTRIAQQLSQSDAHIVVTHRRRLESVAGLAAEALCLDTDTELLAGEDGADLGLATPPEGLAYVIYTSGSTGLPKGVAVEHRNIVNYARAICGRLGLSLDGEAEHLQFGAVSTLNTDLGNTSVYAALVSGGTLHVVPDEMAMDGALYAAYASERPIDVLKIAPSQLRALLATGDDSAVLPRRFLVLGGEALGWDLLERVSSAGSCAVINHYGPTETTVGSLTYDTGAANELTVPASTVPIGRPIDNTRAYVVDERRTPVPVGAPGELCIGGAGVARGYLGQSEETERHFVPDLVMPSERMYCTGDRVRRLPGGEIEFLGRVDEQFKIRGFRVEPEEVARAIARGPEVAEAVVVLGLGSAGEERLIAYVVPAPGASPTAVGLRDLLRDQLPEYMIPSAFVSLERLPLGSSGKVDRRALPEPDVSRPELGREFIAARTPTEDAIASYWAEALGVERVGVEDDFFELGGHSLLGTQVVAWIRSTFGTQLPLHVLFESPTVAALAAAVDEGGAIEDDMAQLLEELEGMSDEEAQRALASERLQHPDE